jgi:hypothetical protein
MLGSIILFVPLFRMNVTMDKEEDSLSKVEKVKIRLETLRKTSRIDLTHNVSP